MLAESRKRLCDFGEIGHMVLSAPAAHPSAVSLLLRQITSAEAALAFIARERDPSARHNCYAYKARATPWLSFLRQLFVPRS